MTSKTKQKRQKLAKQLQHQLLKTAELLTKYYEAHSTEMRENGEHAKIYGSDDIRLKLAIELREYASLLW